MNLSIRLAERGFINDPIVRVGIRKLLAERLETISKDTREAGDWIRDLESRPVAENTGAANKQHYEIPPEYFETVLGPGLKYSSGYWDGAATGLEQAEATMLRLTVERAQIADGQRILDLGCGWGALALSMARNFPASEIVAVSNSRPQGAYIERIRDNEQLPNLTVLTRDINTFTPDRPFDRIVSVEMFEHVRNHRELLRRVHQWLRPGGKLFVHIFAHRSQAYLYEARDSKDWMSKHFFTGGIMPSAELLPAAAENFTEEERWHINGLHYSKTLETWLYNHDHHREAILEIFRRCYGGKDARLWYQRWRLFYMACSELFRFREGAEWGVLHYRFAANDS